jgi:hypothetical protein
MKDLIMHRHCLLLSLTGLLALSNSSGSAEVRLRLPDRLSGPVEVTASDRTFLASPSEGLWSVATNWHDGWPSGWVHAHPERVETSGDWTILHGRLPLAGGALQVRDAYRLEHGLVRGVRRWTWTGTEPLTRVTLSVRWIAPGAVNARPMMPGIVIYGNPAGEKTGNHAVTVHSGKAGDKTFFEEHRFAAPWTSVEWKDGAASRTVALHTLPSPVFGANQNDQWWTLGLISGENSTELASLSGPTAANHRNSVTKALQGKFLEYPDTWVSLRPGAVVEKTFWLEAMPETAVGAGFRQPLRTAMRLHPVGSPEGLPGYDETIREKYRFALSRWRDRDPDAGFEMYPDYVKGMQYVMGWCGQAEAASYAMLALADRIGDATMVDRGQRALDWLTRSPFNDRGFLLNYNAETGQWKDQDPVSQGQAMEVFARAILTGRTRPGVKTERWEAFLKQACTIQATRILQPNWNPRNTAEAFFVSPLCKGFALFGSEDFKRAAVKAGEYYAQRHLTMAEPYWGGTLDANCEDKEGAWAAFQAFLALYELTREARYLEWASHAMDVTLSYTVLWDIDLPAGRLRDHGLKTRGWTIVSAQNQHLDVFGVMYTPELWRMGDYLGRDDLKRLAAVMYRSCGQMMDPYGSSGEQIQQTNFAQHGDMSNVFRLRGGYSENWTVFWITAHFLNAASEFERMGVDLDRLEESIARTSAATEITPAPLYRDPVYDGAADPVLVWNPQRDAWWMFYTQRRAKLDLPGVEWCHGTEIGVAESRDEGLTWTYLGTLALKAPDAEYSFWAPDVIRDDAGRYHFFVSYVPGAAATHRNWGGQRHIFHYSSDDLWQWTFERRVPLSSDYCIDPTLFRRPNGAWRMWYKDEGHDSKTYAVESRDLKEWVPVKDPGVSKLYGEGPKAFRFKDSYWLIKDPNSGLDVYRSDDLEAWKYQGKILDKPGTRNSDATIGKHADVVVCGDRAYIIYFTHPYTEDAPARHGVSPLSNRHTALQAAELEVHDGTLVCDRNKKFRIRLTRP